MVDQKMVMAHVYGHCDFFKNNFWFAHTNRKMMDEMANHATRMRAHGSTSWAWTRSRTSSTLPVAREPDRLATRRSSNADANRARSRRRRSPRSTGFKVEREYMAASSTRRSSSRRQRKKREDETHKAQEVPRAARSATCCCSCSRHAPLEPWQGDMLAIVRDEAYYFAPQGQTKIMNEGWASYWHSTIMTERALTDVRGHRLRRPPLGHAWRSARPAQPVQARRRALPRHRGPLEQGPLRQGVGRVRRHARAPSWDRKLGLGRQKIFEVRRLYNDVTFIDEFLTPEFCKDQKLFVFGYNDKRQPTRSSTASSRRSKRSSCSSSPTSASRTSTSSTATSRTAASCSWVISTRASISRWTTPATRW